MTYPYWENADRGTEDVLALLLAVNVLSALAFIIQLIAFIITATERKKR